MFDSIPNVITTKHSSKRRYEYTPHVEPKHQFHARTSVRRKRYVYTFRVISHEDVGDADVFLSRSVTEVRLRRNSKVNMKTFESRLLEIAPLFRGKHDFSAFAVMKEDDDRPVVRT